MNRSAILVSTLVLTSLPVPAQPPCAPLKDSERAALSDYVQKKFKLPAGAKLDASELSFVGNTCFRNVRFQAQPGGRNFQMDLIVSPDLRFLAREWMDVRVDPVEEEKRKQAALAERLAHGTFATRGAKDAPVIITLFSDFQCPYCAQMAKGLMQDILPGQEQKVRVAFRNFPLPMHPWARAAAEAAACAQRQGDRYFWDLHDYLFEHQKALTLDGVKGALIEQAAALADFDLHAFIACLNEKQTAAAVDEDIALGKDLGVTGTPTLFIGGERVVGYRPEQIRTLIQETGGAGETAESPKMR